MSQPEVVTNTNVEEEGKVSYKKIKVINLPANYNNQAFSDLVSKYGRVVNYELQRKKDSVIGFAAYLNTDDAQYAVYKLWNSTVGGRNVKAYGYPLTEKDIEEEQKRKEKANTPKTNFSGSPVQKKKKKPAQNSLRFLTPINPSFGDDGEFVSVGQSIPAGPPKKKFQGNQGGNNPGKKQNQGKNQGNNQGNNQGGAKNQVNNQGNNQGNNRKGNQQGTKNTNTDQNNTNQNQTKPKNNPGKATGNNQGGNAKKTGKAKYQLKSHPDSNKSSNILQPQEDILDNSPLTYYEVTVRNTSTNEIVLTLLRRQDELDRPIILKQEITF